MKKILTFILSVALLFVVTISHAYTPSVHIVTVTSYQFSPNSFSANVGDMITWTRSGNDAIPHNISSISIPEGALPFVSPDLTEDGQSFTYEITVEGEYTYECTHHGLTDNMRGSFTAGQLTGLPSENVLDYPKLVFPNPFTDRVKIYYNQPGDLMVFNVLGNKVADVVLEHPDTPEELNLSNLYPGIYFITLYSEGRVVETRKVVKAR